MVESNCTGQQNAGALLWEQQWWGREPLLPGSERVLLKRYRQRPLQDSLAGAVSGRRPSSFLKWVRKLMGCLFPVTRQLAHHLCFHLLMARSDVKPEILIL